MQARRKANTAEKLRLQNKCNYKNSNGACNNSKAEKQVTALSLREEQTSILAVLRIPVQVMKSSSGGSDDPDSVP